MSAIPILPSIRSLSKWDGHTLSATVDLWDEPEGILLQSGDDDGVVHALLDAEAAKELRRQLDLLISKRGWE